jgi:Ca2+-binding EF-hand superfamily protein
MACASSGNNIAILERVFLAIDTDKSGFIEWEEFLRAMSTVRCGTYEEKINLFFNLFDADGNGVLTFSEITAMCKLNLSADISELDDVVDDISSYFAR